MIKAYISISDSSINPIHSNSWLNVLFIQIDKIKYFDNIDIISYLYYQDAL